jgi:hypothetical protein
MSFLVFPYARACAKRARSIVAGLLAVCLSANASVAGLAAEPALQATYGASPLAHATPACIRLNQEALCAALNWIHLPFSGGRSRRYMLGVLGRARKPSEPFPTAVSSNDNGSRSSETDTGFESRYAFEAASSAAGYISESESVLWANEDKRSGRAAIGPCVAVVACNRRTGERHFAHLERIPYYLSVVHRRQSLIFLAPPVDEALLDNIDTALKAGNDLLMQSIVRTDYFPKMFDGLSGPDWQVQIIQGSSAHLPQVDPKMQITEAAVRDYLETSCHIPSENIGSVPLTGEIIRQVLIDAEGRVHINPGRRDQATHPEVFPVQIIPLAADEDPGATEGKPLVSGKIGIALALVSSLSLGLILKLAAAHVPTLGSGLLMNAGLAGIDFASLLGSLFHHPGTFAMGLIGAALLAVMMSRPAGSFGKPYIQKAQQIFGENIGQLRDLDPGRQEVCEAARWELIRSFYRTNPKLPPPGEIPILGTVLAIFTDYCTQCCQFCFLNSSPLGKQFLNPEALNSFLQDWPRKAERKVRMTIAGGEPTADRERFLQFLRRNGGHDFSISTNAWFADTPENAKSYLEAIQDARGEGDQPIPFTLPADTQHQDGWESRLAIGRNFLNAYPSVFPGGLVTLNHAHNGVENLRRLLDQLPLEDVGEPNNALVGTEKDYLFPGLSPIKVRVRSRPMSFHGRGFMRLGESLLYTPTYTTYDKKTILSESLVVWATPRDLTISANGTAVPVEPLVLSPMPLRLGNINEKGAVAAIRDHYLYDPLVHAVSDTDWLARLVDFAREYDPVLTDTLLTTPLHAAPNVLPPQISLGFDLGAVLYWLFLDPVRRFYSTLRFLQQQALEAGIETDIVPGLRPDSPIEDVRHVAIELVEKLSNVSVSEPVARLERRTAAAA